MSTRAVKVAHHHGTSREAGRANPVLNQYSRQITNGPYYSYSIENTPVVTDQCPGYCLVLPPARGGAGDMALTTGELAGQERSTRRRRISVRIILNFLEWQLNPRKPKKEGAIEPWYLSLFPSAHVLGVRLISTSIIN